MWTEESKTKQDQVLMVQEPDRGIGYQMIAAFQRLGIKSLVKGRAASYKLQPLQTLESEKSSNKPSAILIAPTQILRDQTPLSGSDFENLKSQILEKDFETSEHTVLVLPLCMTPEHANALLQLRESITLVLAPLPVGFRDGGFFELLTSALRAQNGVDWETLKRREPFEGIFSSDLCGFLISILWNSKFFKKILVAPSTRIEPSKLMEVLENELEFFATPWEKLRFKIKPSPKSSETDKDKETPWFQNQHSKIAMRLLDVLPSATTPTTVWAKKIADHLERNPELDLHFPPARTP